ncbi:LCP family protein [Streptomyces sp. H34-S4]|nr:LCP family protein [Streptomyces sp. H34-S4]
MRWTASVVALLILGTAAAGYLYYRHLNANIRSGQRLSGDSGVAKSDADAAGRRPLNILMLGSDSRNKPENVALGGSWDSVGSDPLADVQMLIHISADRKNASVTSVPRDTIVEIPECTEPKTGTKFKATKATINQTLGRGGAGCTLATWEKLTNIYIDHWMTIDFSGVVKMADAIGGVDVCVNQDVYDGPKPGVGGGSGLKLRAGTTKVQGEQALQWLRTRHAFGSDLGRAKAQHMYMNSMIRGLKSQNAFTDIPRLTNLAEAATKSLEVSEEIGSVKKLLDLALLLKDVPVNRITMATIPVLEAPSDRNRVVIDTADAEKMWTMLRKDVALDANGDPAPAGSGSPSAPAPGPTPATSQPPASDPAKTTVQVVNGTGVGAPAVSKRATAIAGQLVSKGFALAKADSTLTPEKATLVRYATDAQAADAQAVAAALGIPAGSVQKSATASKITVVVGADWREGDAYPQQPAPEAGAVPETAEVLNGTDTSCMDVYGPYQKW